MELRNSEYRGWTLCCALGDRRKVLGHGVRNRPPRKVVMAVGWGSERTVLEALRRQVDAFEDARCDDSDATAGDAAG